MTSSDKMKEYKKNYIVNKFELVRKTEQKIYWVIKKNRKEPHPNVESNVSSYQEINEAGLEEEEVASYHAFNNIIKQTTDKYKTTV